MLTTHSIIINKEIFSNISSDHSAHGRFILITLLAHKDPDDSRWRDDPWSVPQSPSGLSLQLSRRNLIRIIGKNCQLVRVSMKDYHLIVIGVLNWFMSKHFVDFLFSIFVDHEIWLGLVTRSSNFHKSCLSLACKNNATLKWHKNCKNRSICKLQRQNELEHI